MKTNIHTDLATLDPDEIKEHTIINDDGRDLTFKGIVLAAEWTVGDSGHPDFSGETGRGEIYNILKTVSGKIVCAKCHTTQWQGEQDSNVALVCQPEDTEAMIEFFGLSKLGKKVLEQAGVTISQNI